MQTIFVEFTTKIPTTRGLYTRKPWGIAEALESRINQLLNFPWEGYENVYIPIETDRDIYSHTAYPTQLHQNSSTYSNSWWLDALPNL